MIELTSLPTYPTSVYFVASTRKNGEFVSFASRLAISVFPVPVGPFNSRFLGTISALISSGSSFLRHRLRKATAMAFLASVCPMTNRSKYSTSCWGTSCASVASKDLKMCLSLL